MRSETLLSSSVSSKGNCAESMEYGVFGRVLYCGLLEKKRDGAVRGGWATRLFVLTADSLHYFRRHSDQELLGEERGKLPLSSVKAVRAMPEDDVPPAIVEPNSEHYYLEITTTENRTFLMRVPISEASTCESWSIAIEEQRKMLASDTNKNDPQDADVSALEPLPSPSLLARNHEIVSMFQSSPPRIAMVSVVNPSEKDVKNLQRVVKRRVGWGEVLDLGVLAHGCACVLLLQDGGSGRIGTQALMASWDAGQTCWIEVMETEYPTEIEVSVECKVLSPKRETESLVPDAKRKPPPKWIEMLDEGSSVGFLLMCLFVHLLYGVEAFHWSHKFCLTIGAALAITTILNGPSRPTATAPMHPKTPSSLLPKLHFHLTVHRCRIKMQGSEYLYPEKPLKRRGSASP